MPHIIEMTDLSQQALQIYANLTQGNPFKAEEVFLAESEKVIHYALQAGCKPLSFLTERQNAGLSLLQQWDTIPVYTGSRETIRTLTGYTLDRGFLCAMERPKLPEPAVLIKTASRVAVLRNIQDPTDLGAIFRSAAALGVDCIFIGENCCDPLYRRSVRVSMGTVFQVPWTVIHDYGELAEKGFSLLSITQHLDSHPLEPSHWRECPKLAIAMDGRSNPNGYQIPLKNGAEPLTWASASAVLFWMLRKP